MKASAVECRSFSSRARVGQEHLWQAFIPIDTRLRDASRAGLTPSQHDSNSRGVLAYRALLKTLLASQVSPELA